MFTYTPYYQAQAQRQVPCYDMNSFIDFFNEFQRAKQRQLEQSRPKIVKKVEAEDKYQIQIFKEYGDFETYEVKAVRDAYIPGVINIVILSTKDNFKKVFQFELDSIELEKIDWEYFESDNVLVLNIPKKVKICCDSLEFGFPAFLNFDYPYYARQQKLRLIQKQNERHEERTKDAKVRKAEKAKKAETRAARKAEEKARKEAEEEARRKAEEEAIKEAKEKTQREAEEKARRVAEEKARRVAEEKARRVAEEKARRIAEVKARREAEEKLQRAAEEKVRKEAEEMAQRVAEEKAEDERREAYYRQQQEFFNQMFGGFFNQFEPPQQKAVSNPFTAEKRENDTKNKNSTPVNKNEEEEPVYEKGEELKDNSDHSDIESIDSDDDANTISTPSSPASDTDVKKSSFNLHRSPSLEEVEDEEFVMFRKKFGK